jgi:hypothetical protein
MRRAIFSKAISLSRSGATMAQQPVGKRIRLKSILTFPPITAHRKKDQSRRRKKMNDVRTANDAHKLAVTRDGNSALTSHSGKLDFMRSPPRQANSLACAIVFDAYLTISEKDQSKSLTSLLFGSWRVPHPA